ncbi:MAG: hypothetical protein ABIT36_13375 [Steroidobacteraceae bacterium]
MKMFNAVVLLALATGANAQNPAPANANLEPAVNTSAPAPVAPVVTTKSAAAAAPAAKPATPRATGKAMDRLELEATQITGNRELPKVMYVVPWRRADLGDLLARPTNSLLDEALAPVDRDVFRRQSQYYQALQPDSAAAAPAAGKGER